ncbi:MAG: hypothetical protein ACYDAB_01925 [bacterium]
MGKPSTPEFYTIPNVARALRLSRQRIHALIEAGDLRPSHVAGVGRVVTAEALAQFLQARKTKKPKHQAKRTQGNLSAPSVVAAPAAPFPSSLPLNDQNFLWQQFEKFCEAFISVLPGVKNCHLYGKRGGRQKGIDILADMVNGERWAFQAKQVRQFNRKHAQKAIAETTYEADRYVLLVSTEVGTAVQDICVKDGKWDIWDSRDISRKVRHDLPLDAAARLVETHFGPEWRRRFLGITGLEAFVTADKYFGALPNPVQLFHHHWTLVGRSSTLKEIDDFVNSSQYRVAILYGRGGIGKTKILKAAAQRLADKGHELRFLVDGVPLTAESFDHIPAIPLTLVVDDAHRAEDLRTVLAFARQQEQPTTKVILSTRPQGRSRIQSLLAETGFDTREISEFAEIRELAREDVKQLAAQVLGSSNTHLIDRLAAATLDSPLITVVGGRLLAGRGIDPALLENDDEFRRAALSRFEEELLGSVSRKIDRNTVRAILQVTAALGPVNFSDRATVQKVSEFTQIDSSNLLSAVGLLEDYGLLLRRGRTLRITPDVLADHILHEACVTSKGASTGYADKIFMSFVSVQPANLLRNLAELDWRMHHTTGDAGLLDQVWDTIEKEFKAAPHSSRSNILTILEDVAYFQPHRVLNLVEFAIRNPSQAAEDPVLAPFASLYRYTHQDVLNHLPKLLRRIGYNYEYLPRACDLLWELGRDDQRQLNPYPDHPIRILTDLADYDFGWPFAFNEAVLEAAKRWLAASDAHDHRYSPLDVITPLFKKTSFSTRSEGHAFTITPFQVPYEATKPLRAKALAMVLQCARSPRISVVFKALKVMEGALRGPEATFNLRLDENDWKRWVPDRLQIIDALEDIVNRSPVTLIHLKVIEILRWYARRESSEEIRNRAREVIESVKDSAELRLFRALKESFDFDWYDDGTGKDDYAQKQQASTEFRKNVADEFVKTFPKPSAGFPALNGDLSLLSEAGIQHDASAFIRELSQAHPSYAEELCQMAVDKPDTQLSGYFGAMLSGVRDADTKKAARLIERALDTGDVTLSRSIAAAYSVWLSAPTAADQRILTRLFGHSDPNVKALALRALVQLARTDQKLAKDLALAIDIGDNPILAERIAELFHPKWGIPLEALTDDELRSLIAKLKLSSGIDDYHVSEFLSNVSARMPEATVELLLDRIAHGANLGSSKYRPLPFHFHHPLTGLGQSPKYIELLRKVRDVASKKTWHARWWGAQLFKEVSLGYSPQSLAVLGEWIASSKKTKLEAAGALLREADPNFVFRHRDFVVSFLRAAQTAGEDCFERVGSHLFASAISGGRSGTAGKPMPQDVALRDQAAAAASDLPAGSPEHKFYDSLSKYAEKTIREDLARDEEMFE